MTVFLIGATNGPAYLGILPLAVQVPIFIAFFFGFGVKLPMVPFHTWLPDAHVEAPTAGSVILAGLLLKMGGYGVFPIGLRMLPAPAPNLWGPPAGFGTASLIVSKLLCPPPVGLQPLLSDPR